MKLIKFTVSYLLWMILALPAFGLNNADKELNAAHQFYTNHQYEEASQRYLQLIQRGYESDLLHYNLGNSYYRLNQIGRAILHYEKAIKLNPNNEDALYNLKIANLKVASKIVPMTDFFMVRWAKGILQFFEIDTWALAQVIFGFMMLIFFSVYLFSAFQKFGFYAGVFSLLLMIFSGLFAWSARSNLKSHNYGVITAPSYHLKSEPSEKSREILTVREGVKFMRMETIGAWNQIKLSDGNIGWIEKSAFEMI